MKQYKLYLFDLDGTLIDSDQMLIETFKELYKMYDPKRKIDEAHIRTFSGPQITETLSKEFPNIKLEESMKEYRERSRKYYDKYVHLFDGAYSLLEKLAKNNIPFGIITNKHRYATIYTYELLDLAKFNIFSICADDVKELKPAPEGIYKAMEKFGIKDKSEVVYVGDGQIDYLTAKNAGVDFAYICWSPREISKESKIDAKIKSYAEFAKEIGL